MRIIECGVKSEFITGDEIVIGAAGSHDDVYIELTFSKEWENTTKTISWTNAMGEDPIMLTIGTQHIVDLWERRYKLAIPYEAKEYAGEVKMSIKGVIVRDGIEEVAVTTNEATFTVLESNWDDDMQHAQDITPTNAEIFQAQLDSMAEDIILAGKAGEYAASAQESADEAAVSASTAKKSEEGAILNSSDAEAWAVGTRGGVPVGIDDEAYQNNAKWYKDLAGEIAGGDFVTVEEATAMFNEVKDLANEAQETADNAQSVANAAQTAANDRYTKAETLGDEVKEKYNLEVNSTPADLFDSIAENVLPVYAWDKNINKGASYDSTSELTSNSSRRFFVTTGITRLIVGDTLQAVCDQEETDAIEMQPTSADECTVLNGKYIRVLNFNTTVAADNVYYIPDGATWSLYSGDNGYCCNSTCTQYTNCFNEYEFVETVKSTIPTAYPPAVDDGYVYFNKRIMTHPIEKTFLRAIETSEAASMVTVDLADVDFSQYDYIHMNIETPSQVVINIEASVTNKGRCWYGSSTSEQQFAGRVYNKFGRAILQIFKNPECKMIWSKCTNSSSYDGEASQGWGVNKKVYLKVSSSTDTIPAGSKITIWTEK